MDSSTHNDAMATNTPLGFKHPSPAQYLRVIGTGLFILSGIIYMLQGYGELQDSLRYWVYLALSGALCAGGFFSQRLMQDAKGARLFFVMAMLIVPVQITQLGAMVLHAVQQGEHSHFSITLISAIAVPSLVCAVLASIMGFSVLVRAHAKALSMGYLSMNTLMLLPYRDAIPTLLICTAMVVIAVAVYFHSIKHKALFNTAEGIAAKWILTLPLLIALARYGLAENSWFGAGICLNLFAIAALLAAHSIKTNTVLREVCLLLSAVCGSVGVPIVVAQYFTHSAAFTLLSGVVLSLLCLFIQRYSHATWFYKLLQTVCGLMLFSTLGEQLWQTVTVIMVAASFLYLSIKQRSLLLSVVYSVLIISSVATLNISQFIQVNVSAWVGLALVGIAMVALSSMAERFGTALIVKLQSALLNLRGWGL